MLFYRSLICKLDDSEENTEALPKHAQSTHDEHKAASSGTKHKATASGTQHKATASGTKHKATAICTNNANDLYTVATTTSNRSRKLNRDLVKTRKYVLYIYII